MSAGLGELESVNSRIALALSGGGFRGLHLPRWDRSKRVGDDAF
jgi:hypothetical protein